MRITHLIHLLYTSNLQNNFRCFSTLTLDVKSAFRVFLFNTLKVVVFCFFGVICNSFFNTR